MKKREFRTWKTELRTQMVGGKEKIVGYAAVFNQLSEPLKIGSRSFRERVMPGAFDRCLQSTPDIRGLVNHDPALILGRTKSGTMTVNCDDHGLRYEIDPPDTTYSNDLRESLRRGDIDSSSFGFYTTEDNWITDESGQTIRELLSIDCFDVSPVTYPAYTGSSSGVEALRALFPDGEPDGIPVAPPIRPESFYRRGELDRAKLRLKISLLERMRA
jgi:HK97 family phage prohead protease